MRKLVCIISALLIINNVSAQVYPQRVYENGKVGYKLSDKWVASPVYEYGSEFRNGFALVRLDGKFGFIDSTGNLIVKCLYNSCTLYDDNGIATGKIGDTKYYLDKEGNAFRSLEELNAVAVLKSSEYKKKAANYSVGDYTPTLDQTGKWGYKQFGEWVIQPRFEAAEEFSDGLAAVLLGGKWGYIGKNGTSYIPFKYEQGCVFVDGLARVKLYDKWGFIDKSGATVIPFKYAMAADYSNGLARVSYNGKNGFIDKTGEWFDSEEDMMQTFSAFARNYVERDINEWQKKGKYEKIAHWQARVTDNNRKARIDSLVASAKSAFIEKEGKKVKQEYELVDYDSETEVFLVYDKRFGNLLVPVPIQEAASFDNNFNRIVREDEYIVDGDNLRLASARFILPGGRTYAYNNNTALSFSTLDIDYNFEPVNFDTSNIKDDKNNSNKVLASRQVTAGPADVDINIPQNHNVNDSTFVLIIANEDYKFVSTVPFAKNDGHIFEQYCHKTLGIPSNHIHRQEDATLGTFMNEVDWITNIAKVYDGNAHLMVYYAGHGIPDESTRDSFLLPVDGTGSNTKTAYKLSELYSKLNEYPTASTIVFLDACFSGAQRNGTMLASARGVAIKPKAEKPEGKMIILSAASADETAYPFYDKGHGLFSYYLFKKLQESKGTATIGELSDYIKENVSRQSIVLNSKSQTPSVNVSSEFSDDWYYLKLL